MDDALRLLRDGCIDDTLCSLSVGRKAGACLVQFGEEFARKGSDITRHDDGLQFLGMITKPELKVPRARGAILDSSQLGDCAITLQRHWGFDSIFHFWVVLFRCEVCRHASLGVEL